MKVLNILMKMENYPISFDDQGELLPLLSFELREPKELPPFSERFEVEIKGHFESIKTAFDFFNKHYEFDFIQIEEV